MYTIALTGNFGTGKSTVAGILVELGAKLIDADKLGHDLLEQDPQVKTELLDSFGKAIINARGKIDRRKLGKLAFESKQKTIKLNQIMKHRIKQRMIQKLEEYRKLGISLLVLEAALLVKTDWKNIIDEVWVTTAPQDVIVKRLKSQRGYDEKEVLSRLQRQLSPEEMLQQADLVIDTDYSLDELRVKVNTLWAELLVRAAATGKGKK